MNPNPHTPPRWAEYLLELLIPLHRLEALQGDLYELFHKRLEQDGPRRARLLFVHDVLQMLRPQLWRPEPGRGAQAGPSSLLGHYLAVALRNLRRSRFYAALNAAGLAVGLATGLLIALYVLHELSYDRYHRKADRTYRIVTRGRLEGSPMHFPVMGPSVARDLSHDYPEIREATRLWQINDAFFAAGPHRFREPRFARVDSNFFSVFSIPFVKGDLGRALAQPGTVVVTEAIARKYFPGRDPMGQVLLLGATRRPLRITGVVREMPANSHFHFDLFASLAGEPETKGTSWMNDLHFLVYLVLDEDAGYRHLQAKMPEVVEKYMGPDLQKMMGVSLAEFRRKGNDVGFELQPLTAIHLHSHLQFELEPNSDIRYVYLFSAVALFVLVIACINFTNLATARAAQRAKEVGVRKVLGSLREQLIGQFLLESVLLTAFALLLGVGLTYLALPAFNRLTGKELHLMAHPLLLAGLPLLGLGIGVAAGVYPAFVLSAFRPASVLKGPLQWAGGRLSVRNVLVVFQFGIAITLIVGTLVAYRQLAFLQQTRVGFDKEQTLVIHDTHLLGKNETVLKAQLERMAGVKKASVSGFVPVGASRLSNDVFHPEGNQQQRFMFRLYGVDYDYLPTMGMQLAQGRNFSPQFATDSSGILLNETAARALGWGDQAVGKKLYRPIPVPNRKSVYTVIGVVRDFHHESLHHKIAPLVMTLGGNSGSILVKLVAGDPSRQLASAESLWKHLGTGAPFGYSFLNSRFESVYRAEQKTGKLMSLFARLTVFITCLGLFGLAAYTAERRRREISIRKVLGATTGSILLLLSRDFLRLVLLANLVAWPLAWYASRRWLENFAYRIEISPWFFGVAGAVALVVALVTVGFQALKATRVNPAATLRND